MGTKLQAKPKLSWGSQGSMGDWLFGSGLGSRLGKKNSCELAEVLSLEGKTSPIRKNESS